MSSQIGCKTKFDIWSSQNIPLCSTIQQFKYKRKLYQQMTFFRSQNNIYLDLMWNGLDDIERRTGCQKPCIFKKYSFPGDRQVCKYPSCLRYQMCTTGDLNEIKYSLYLPIFIFGQIGYFANIFNILIKYAGDLTEIGPFRFLFGRCFKLHKCRDGTPHLSSFLVGSENDLSYIS